jgi:hypothetical protein
MTSKQYLWEIYYIILIIRLLRWKGSGIVHVLVYESAFE